MQIKYLKDAPTARAGDIRDVSNNDARILIILGYAEPYKPKPKTRTKATVQPETADIADTFTETE